MCACTHAEITIDRLCAQEGCKGCPDAADYVEGICSGWIRLHNRLLAYVRFDGCHIRNVNPGWNNWEKQDFTVSCRENEWWGRDRTVPYCLANERASRSIEFVYSLATKFGVLYDVRRRYRRRSHRYGRRRYSYRRRHYSYGRRRYRYGRFCGQRHRSSEITESRILLSDLPPEVFELIVFHLVVEVGYYRPGDPGLCQTVLLHAVLAPLLKVNSRIHKMTFSWIQRLPITVDLNC